MTLRHVQVEMVAEGKTASRHLEMSKEICPQSFPFPLDAFRVFAKNTRLLIPPPPPPSSPPSIFRPSMRVFKDKVCRSKYNNFIFHDILFSRILMNMCYSYTFKSSSGNYFVIINFCHSFSYGTV